MKKRVLLLLFAFVALALNAQQIPGLQSRSSVKKSKDVESAGQVETLKSLNTTMSLQQAQRAIGRAPQADNGTVPLPFTEGFEASSNLPEGWSTRPTPGGEENWRTTTSSAYVHSGTRAAYLYSEYDVYQDSWLFTPAFRLEAGVEYKINFWTNLNATAGDKLELNLGTAAAPANMTKQLVNITTVKGMREVTQTFQVTTSGVYYLGFHAYNSVKDNWYYSIDDVSLEEVQSEPEIPLPFTEGFEASSNLPEGWTTRPTPGGEENWRTTTTARYIHSGSRAAFLSYEYDVNQDSWLFTPSFRLEAGVEYKVNFWTWRGNANDKLELKLGKKADPVSMDEQLVNIADNVSLSALREVSKTFQVATSGVYYLGFHAYNNANDLNYFSIDDVSLGEAVQNDLKIESSDPFAPYLQIPISQFFQLKAKAVNAGSAAQTNVRLAATMNGNPAGTSVPIATLAPGATTPDMTISSVGFESIGPNTLVCTVEADQTDENPSNNSATYTVEASKNLYAVENATTLTGYTAGIGTGYSYGNVFVIHSAATLSQAAIGFQASSVDLPFEVALYKLSPSSIAGEYTMDPANPVFTPVSATRTVSGFQYVNLPATPLEAGSTYFLAVKMLSNTSLRLGTISATGKNSYFNTGANQRVRPQSNTLWAIRMILSVTSCDTPTDLKTEPQQQSARLLWTGDAPQYIVTVEGESGSSTYVATTNELTINGLTNGATYRWSVKAICDATHESAVSSSSFTTKACEEVTIFPFTEGFETGISNCWVQNMEAGTLAWKVVGDNWNGSDLEFPETLPHSGSSFTIFQNIKRTPADVTKLITQGLNFSNIKAPKLYFWHTQYEYSDNISSDQDELRIYYKTSAAGSWTLMAEYTKNIPNWKQELIRLPNAEGATEYYIAFEGTAQFGHGICLDDVKVVGSYDNDATVTSINEPISKGYMTATETVVATIVNEGAQPITSLPINLEVNGTVVATETISTSIPVGGTYTHTFAAKADLLTVQTHTIKVYTTLSGDGDRSNDTITKQVINYGEIAVMGANTLVSACSGSFVDDGLSANYAEGIAEYIMTFVPPTAGDRMRIRLNSFNVKPYELYLGLLDLPGDTLYVYNGTTANPANLIIALTGDVNSALPYTFESTSNDGALTFKFSKSGFGLGDYPGWQADILCHTPFAKDAVLTKLTAPTSGVLKTDEAISITVKNIGKETLANIPVVLKTNCVEYTATIPGPIAPFASQSYTFTNVNLSIPGDYTITAYTDIADEGDRSNDTLSTATLCLLDNPVVWNFEQGMPADFTLLRLDNGIAYNTNIFPNNEAWAVMPTGSGNHAAASQSWFSNTFMEDIQANRWMITSAITIPSVAKLSWSAMAYEEAPYNDGYMVKLSTTAGKTANDFDVTLFSTTGEDNIWTNHNIDLSAYTGKSVTIAFIQNSMDKNVLLVDDITVAATTPVTTIHSGTVFAFAPTLPSGMTLNWSRAAVNGISNPANSGTGSINETLLNTSDKPVTATYVCTYTLNGCVKIVNMLVTVKAPVIISATAGVNGTINPSGSVAVVYGADQTFSIAPNVGYKISQVLVDGINNAAAVSSGSYTFVNVTANHTISATFEQVNHTITVTCGNGGNVYPGGTVLVSEGTDKTFQIVANNGYKIQEVLVDGVSNAAAMSSGIYTFENVTASHTLEARFEASVFTITATAGAHGTINPQGTISANYGDSKSFTITPAAGYTIKEVLVDGVNNAAAVTSGNYTFTNITGHHTISATFEGQQPKITDITINGNSLPVTNAMNYMATCGEQGISIILEGTGEIRINSELYTPGTTRAISYTNHKADVVITATVAGVGTISYTLTITEALGSATPLYIERWGATLAIVNNPANNGGYTFDQIRWYRDGSSAVVSTDAYVVGNINTHYADVHAVETGAWHHTCRTKASPAPVQIVVYPNPVLAAQTLNVNLPEGLNEVNIDVYDINGKLVKQHPRVTTTLTAPTGTGIYVLKIQLPDGSITTEKIVVK